MRLMCDEVNTCVKKPCTCNKIQGKNKCNLCIKKCDKVQKNK